MSDIKKKKRFRFLPGSAGLTFGLIVGIAMEIIFLMLVMALDVLPFKYVAAIVGVLVLIDIIILILLSGEKKNSIKHILGLIVIMLVVQVLLVGDVYVYSTYDTLQKISKKKATWETYNVVTLVDGQYQTVDDIKGEKVYRMDMDSKQLNEASERLVTKEEVYYHDKPDLLTVGHELVDENGNTEDKIILVTTPNYKILKEQIDGYKEKTHSIFKIKVKKRADDNSKAVDVTKDSFNVLISGMDVYGSIDQEALSDVNMVMTVNPETQSILLTSIPRDSYIPLHSSGQNDKLTHSGIYGHEETQKTIEDFLDIDINYYIKVNFTMLKKIVDAIDGIDVYSDYEFHSAIHPEYTYERGWNHLDGHQALYFARERKAFLEGDMQRNVNQQKVLTAIIKKVTQSRVIMTSYTHILNIVERYMATNLSDKDLKQLAKLTIKNMTKVQWSVKSQSIKGSTGMAPCYSMGNQELSCVFPYEDDVTECKKGIHDIMYPVDNTTKKKQQSTESTKASGDQSSGDGEDSSTDTDSGSDDSGDSSDSSQ